MSIIGTKEDVIIGNTRRGADASLGIVGPIQLAVPDANNVQALVLKKKKHHIFKNDRLGNDPAITGILPLEFAVGSIQ